MYGMRIRLPCRRGACDVRSAPPSSARLGSRGNLAVLFLGITGYARWARHWRTDLPSRVYFNLIPHASDFTH